MDEKYILKQFYGFSNISMSLYENEKCIVNNSKNEIIPDLMRNIIMMVDGNDYHSSLRAILDYVFCAMLKINGTNRYVIIGPVVPYECDDFQAEDIMKEFQITLSTDKKSIKSFFNTLPKYNINQFTTLIKTLDYVINKEKEVEPVILDKVIDYGNDIVKNKEFSFVNHVQEDLEKAVFSMVRYGKVKEIEIKMNEIFHNKGKFPIFSRNIVNSAKLIFTNALALATRAATEGGVPYDVSMSINTYYIEHADDIKSLNDFKSFFKKMFVDFTKKTAEFRSMKSKSGIVSKINKQIYSYMYEKITPSKMAENLSLDVSYLSRTFKKDTGKTITEYINEVKINESKRLLSATEMSIIEISSQLGYSSRNYFHRVFKKYVGITPTQYRNKPN